ncbi:hypothetical protein [Absidia glauca]|uniref:DNA polymerase delta subunit 3 n=1 Tax=Absidia glauca TaxID=4829 RepID=A0A168T213_ABSGL|nr:hypothetical protein [Absidia glauca]
MDYKDYLDTTVLQEKKPVTYRSLARSLNIHVNVAKQALYQYSLAQQSTVSTIYCLTGTSIDNTSSIRLVNEDDLEETKKEYRQLSGVHVYSVLPCKPKDLSVLVTVHKDMVAVPLEDRVKNGLIWNNSVSTIKPGSKPTTTSTTTPTPAPKPPSVPATTTPSKTTFGSSSTTTKKPAASTTPAKRKGTLSFEKAAPKAKKQATEKKKSPSPPPASRKVKTIQVSEDEESEDEEALDARLARSAKIQANDFFSDDDDGDEKMANNNTTEQKHDDSDDHSMKTASPFEYITFD